MSCPVCAPNIDCPEHPDPQTWPVRNGWRIQNGATYQGVPYWYIEGPRRVSFEQACADLAKASAAVPYISEGEK